MRVTSPNVYWGNDGLELGNESNVGTAAGPEDNVNSIECVFVTSPQAGADGRVIASAVVTDNHVETPAVDADYALVVKLKDPVYAAFDTYGQGCQGSFPAPAYCATLNPNGGTLSNSTNSFELLRRHRPWQRPGAQLRHLHAVEPGTITRPAHIYLPSGGPSGTPLATTTITVGATPEFYTATFATPVAVSGTFIATRTARRPDLQLNAGATGVGYYRTAVTGNWNQSGIVDRPSWRGLRAGAGSRRLSSATPGCRASARATTSR